MTPVPAHLDAEGFINIQDTQERSIGHFVNSSHPFSKDENAVNPNVKFVPNVDEDEVYSIQVSLKFFSY